jgi:hypothetical protein
VKTICNNSSISGLGTFAGVFTPSILTILGIILFLRLGYVVGSAGLGRSLVIIALANVISVLTSISLSAVATNLKVKGGGDYYYLISRTLVVEFGGSIGLVLFFAQSVSIAFYCIGFAEAVSTFFPDMHHFMVVSMFFLISYGLLNYATYFEVRTQSPSFRPRFKWFSPRLSLLGFFICMGAMLAIDLKSGAAAIALLFAVYQYLKRTAGPSRWADSSGSHLCSKVNWTAKEFPFCTGLLFTADKRRLRRRRGRKVFMVRDEDKISNQIIGAAIEVHRALRPSLLESAYEECLCREFLLKNITFER